MGEGRAEPGGCLTGIGFLKPIKRGHGDAEPPAVSGGGGAPFLSASWCCDAPLAVHASAERRESWGGRVRPVVPLSGAGPETLVPAGATGHEPQNSSDEVWADPLPSWCLRRATWVWGKRFSNGTSARCSCSSTSQPMLGHHGCASVRASQIRSTWLGSVILLCCHPPPPRLKSLKPSFIQVRNPYQLISSRLFWGPDRSGWPGPTHSRVPNASARSARNRLAWPAKHSTMPLQCSPGQDTHRLSQSKSSASATLALTSALIRKNGCHPHARMTSPIQRAYPPRSASTITNQSSGMARWRWLKRATQEGHQAPSWVAGNPFQATGMAPPLSATLTARLVHRLPRLVASTARARRFSSPDHRRTTHWHKGPKQLVPSISRRFFLFASTLVARIQLPLAYALKDALFLRLQEDGEQRTDLPSASGSGERDARAPQDHSPDVWFREMAKGRGHKRCPR